MPRDTTWDVVVRGPLQGGGAEKSLLVERGVSARRQDLELRLPPR